MSFFDSKMGAERLFRKKLGGYDSWLMPNLRTFIPLKKIKKRAKLNSFEYEISKLSENVRKCKKLLENWRKMSENVRSCWKRKIQSDLTKQKNQKIMCEQIVISWKSWIELFIKTNHKYNSEILSRNSFFFLLTSKKRGI